MLKSQVAVGDDSDQFLRGIHYRNSTNAVLRHQLLGLANTGILGKGDGIQDHSGLCPLHFAHLHRLALGGQVLVKDADSALLGHGNGHSRFGHRIHCR